MKITKNTIKNGHIFQIIHTELNLINEKKNIDNIYLGAKDLNEPKYKILIKKRKDVGMKHLNDPDAFI